MQVTCSFDGSFKGIPSLSSHTLSLVADPQKERKVRALVDYDATNANEISFKTGDVFTVMCDHPSGWSLGILQQGKRGLFPTVYPHCQKLDFIQ